MLYVIDAYNLLFRIMRNERDLKEQREDLIHLLNTHATQSGMRLRLVFDAMYSDGLAQRSHYDSLEIVYTAHGETADEHIIHDLKRELRNTLVTVVTSDKNLAWRARSIGAQTQNINVFMEMLNARLRSKSKKQTTPSTPPPKKEEKKGPRVYSITADENYLREFERRYNELEESTPKRQKRKRATSEYHRWMEIFEKRLKE